MNIYNILNKIDEKFLIANDYRLAEIFNKIDSKLWEKTNHNPKLFLKIYDKDKLSSINISNKLLNIINNIQYEKNGNNINKKIAYFSPEFGVHESLPNYSGGLGVLAGDIIKTAQIENTSFFGVGLMYKKGYFEQKISKNNHQLNYYKKINYQDFPIEPLLDKSGKNITISLELNDITIFINAFKLIINSTFIILLDANIKENGILSQLMDNLYTGSRQLRFLQELSLGIGGVRILEKADINYDILHINEGHAAFALLERARIYAQQNNVNIYNSMEILSKTNVFTTHTPVIHGNEEFDIKLLKKYISKYIENIDISFDDFINIGKSKNISKNVFSMTAFAINLSEKINGVSKLHSETANLMWKDLLFKQNKKIVPVTNGIHFKSWISGELANFLNIDSNKNIIETLNKISNSQIIQIKRDLKRNSLQELIRIMQKRVNNKRFLDFKNAFDINEDYILISFARRFAKYKRADLLFSNINKLKILFNNSNIKIRIIFSGKAHPKDIDGKSLLNNVLNLIDKNNLNEFCHFIPNYDIEIGRLLVQASDVWLNTPIKPLEACGTSGMKSALNFGINLSISDGWWSEAFNGKNGFSIEDNNDPMIVSSNIINIIKNNIIPLYTESKNFDFRAAIMKNSFLTVYKDFSSERMLKDYNKLYF